MAAAAPAAPAGLALPDFSKIPGAQVARFKVIVEDAVTAAKNEDWASLIPCTVSINARIAETTTCRRGEGVVMEFVRLTEGGPIIVQRAGRRYDASLLLTTTTTRTASGTAVRTDHPTSVFARGGLLSVKLNITDQLTALGTVSDFGTNTLTIRMIRVPWPVPAPG